ncbi:hypothetical protein B7494_g4092 [Chlorociboria aeruginascens]|nr:hypothetical protein B7494_g4092 [Chlorociboria aeruginascens]
MSGNTKGKMVPYLEKWIYGIRPKSSSSSPHRSRETLSHTESSNQNGKSSQDGDSSLALLGLPSYGALYQRRDIVNVSKSYSDLPPGEEVHQRTSDGRLIHVNHNRRTTEWDTKRTQKYMYTEDKSKGVATPPVAARVKLQGDKVQTVTLRRLTPEEASAERKVQADRPGRRTDSESSLSGMEDPPPILDVPIIKGRTNGDEDKPPTYGELYMRRDIENVSQNYGKTPAGYEIHRRKTDGRLLYVDHNHRTIRWSTGRLSRPFLAGPRKPLPAKTDSDSSTDSRDFVKRQEDYGAKAGNDGVRARNIKHKRDSFDSADSSASNISIPGKLVRAGHLVSKSNRGSAEYGTTSEHSPFDRPQQTNPPTIELIAQQESSGDQYDTAPSSKDSPYIDHRASSGADSSIVMSNDASTVTPPISDNPFSSPSTLSSSSMIDKTPPIFNSPFTSSSTPSNDPERIITPAKQVPMYLGDFFASEAPRKSYTDKEFLTIAQLLQSNGRGPWSEVPRIYTVLRIIGQLDIIESFIDQGITDIWFPFTSATLPKALSISSHASFLETQTAVLTKGLDLEKDERKMHAHFGRDEELPFKLGDALGAGAYSQVRKIVSISSKREYALKRFRRTGLRKEAAIKSFKGELKILKRIHHQHCVELIASYTDSKWIGLIMSPVADCDLRAFYDHVAQNESRRAVLRTFYGCLSAAMTYLHDSKVRHRDIKPENILVKGDRVYFTDFGISLDWESLSRSTTTEDSAKTPLYCSPEVAQFKSRNSSSDIWSLGCVFLEMATVLSGREIEEMQRFFKNHNDNYRFYTNIEIIPKWSEMLRKDMSPEDSQALQWVASMLRLEPTERPTASTLFELILRSQNGMGSNSFCGTCCEPDASSDDEGSNGELWAEDHESS